jgi:DNA adenine methylase
VTEPGNAARGRPIVKWAGGKARLVDTLLELLPGRIRTYVEPFCGGAALFFRLAAERPRRYEHAVLADKNAELIACYRAIKSDVDALIARLGAEQRAHLALSPEARKADYYRVRDQAPEQLSDLDRAVRLLFLNRTCFNGLWRVNASGKFNVPYGRYENPRIFDEAALREAHAALRDVRLENTDYAEVTRGLGARDFVYFDPPYVPVSRTANFTAYAKDRFGEAEQRHLARVLLALQKQRVPAILSNACSEATLELYARAKHQVVVPMARAINSDPKKRGDVKELLAMTYAPRPKRVRAAS